MRHALLIFLLAVLLCCLGAFQPRGVAALSGEEIQALEDLASAFPILQERNTWGDNFSEACNSTIFQGITAQMTQTLM